MELQQRSEVAEFFLTTEQYVEIYGHGNSILKYVSCTALITTSPEICKNYSVSIHYLSHFVNNVL